ncbi:hypothetical protein CRYUN_Cryun26dG0070600 [Craigia yunnanensis]
MSLEEAPRSPECDVTSMSFDDTELTLGLPGEGRSSDVKFSAKRGFVESVNLNIASCSRMPSGRGDTYVNKSEAGKPPPAKAQVVGWPLELMKDLENLFTCFTIRNNNREESRLMDMVKGIEMFIESCKRIRLMKSSEAAVLALAAKASSSAPKC